MSKVEQLPPQVVLLPFDEVVELHQQVVDKVWMPQYIEGRKSAVDRMPDYGASKRVATFEAPADNSGIVDTTLSVVKKQKHSTHDMWLRFNDGVNTDETALQNTVTYYRLLWGGSLALGYTWSHTHYHRAADQIPMTVSVETTEEDVRRRLANDRAFSVRNNAAAMTPDDVVYVSERIEQVVERGKMMPTLRSSGRTGDYGKFWL